MAGFMNAELVAIRDNLQCGHCGSKFKGTDSQARKVKYENHVVYCSSACRSAASSKRAQAQALKEGKKLRKGVLAGPCKTCGKMFESKADKMFCSLDCYTKSDQFREMQSKHWKLSDAVKAKISSSLKKGQETPCQECGETFYQKRPSKGHPAKKFCSTVCYRAFLAKRFDRWVANPEGMALPQCYDEFLDREELACVVDGCDWKGKHLTLHMNQAHGVKSSDFKRAAGFNLSTGVVSRPLAESLRDRSIVGIATADKAYKDEALELARQAISSGPIRYRSLEGKEHATKARALLGRGPERTCAWCGVVFQQSTPMGRALYCSKECRSKAYSFKRTASGNA